MERSARKKTRLKLSARIRNKRNTAGNFEARVALADRIADLPGIETAERGNEAVPGRVDVYLRRDRTDQGLKRKPARLLCSLDRDNVIVAGLDRWEQYQVLSTGWGKLVDDTVYVYLPRDGKELETVWSIVERAYDRLFDSSAPEHGSLIISTWDCPKYSRTSLQ